MAGTREKPSSFSYTWEAVKLILGLVLAGMVLSGWFGLQTSLGSMMLALLASLLGYAIGGLSGFLFGFPRYLDATAVSSSEDLKASGARTAQGTQLRPSTNLERIVDWLTTMIVGATLVNLQAILEWSNTRFAELSTAITGTEQPVVGGLLVVPFAVAGFLHLYLWARRYLPQEWSAAESLIQKLDQKTDEIKESIQKVQGQIYKVQAATMKNLSTALRDAGVADPIIDKVTQQLSTASGWKDDPWERLGPADANGYVLAATVKRNEAPGAEDPWTATVTIKRVDGAPFTATAIFLLHNTYDPPFQVRRVDGDAEISLDVPCYEGSWIGVVIVPGPTAGGRETPLPFFLSLDLATLPNRPEGFR